MDVKLKSDSGIVLEHRIVSLVQCASICQQHNERKLFHYFGDRRNLYWRVFLQDIANEREMQ